MSLGIGSQGIDQAYGWPGGANLEAWGAAFQIGYLSPDPTKNLTPGKVQDAHAHGVSTVTNWEYAAQAMLGGAAQGAIDGRAAGKQARLLGQPAACPIYYSADWPANSSQYAVCLAYLIAAQDASGFPAGVYGDWGLINYCVPTLHWLWQANAWANGMGRHPSALITQEFTQVNIGGVTCDVDVAWSTNIGSWNANGPVTGLAPPVAPPTGMAVPPPFTIQSVTDKELGTMITKFVPLSLDAQGNGWLLTSYPADTFISISHQGSDPNTDKTYWYGTPHWQARNNMIEVSLTGANTREGAMATPPVQVMKESGVYLTLAQ